VRSSSSGSTRSMCRAASSAGAPSRAACAVEKRHLKRLCCPLGSLILPERVDQASARTLGPPQEEDRQQRALFSALTSIVRPSSLSSSCPRIRTASAPSVAGPYAFERGHRMLPGLRVTRFLGMANFYSSVDERDGLPSHRERAVRSPPRGAAASPSRRCREGARGDHMPRRAQAGGATPAGGRTRTRRQRRRGADSSTTATVAAARLDPVDDRRGYRPGYGPAGISPSPQELRLRLAQRYQSTTGARPAGALRGRGRVRQRRAEVRVEQTHAPRSARRARSSTTRARSPRSPS